MATGIRTIGPTESRRTGAQAIATGLLILRVALAIVFIAHGAQKLFGLFGGGGLSGTAQMFAAMGLKPAMLLATCAGLVEFFGGAALLLGIYTRIAAVVIGLQMIFATVWVHLPNGFFLDWASSGKGHGIEYNLTLIAALAMIALGGAGAFSVAGARQDLGR